MENKLTGFEWFGLIFGLISGLWVLIIPIALIMAVFYLFGTFVSAVVEPAVNAGAKTGEWIKNG
jgi:hypothetical protein